MYFFENEFFRGLERMMRQIPNFAPRGHGVITLYGSKFTDNGCLKDRMKTGNTSKKEFLTKTMSNIRYPPFRIRLNEYIQEREMELMDFRNEKHRIAFTEAIQKLNRNDYALMSAIYLFTAEHKLWMKSKHQVGQNKICFDGIKLQNSTENAYTLFCCAKDLYLGTKHITIKDLAYKDLITPRMFALICNAMAIRRFGLGAIHYNERNTDV